MTLDELGLVRREPRTHTFSSLGVYGTSLFEGVEPVRAKLFPWLWQFCEAGRVTGEVYEGMWFNVGDVRELALAEARIRNRNGKVRARQGLCAGRVGKMWRSGAPRVQSAPRIT